MFAGRQCLLIYDIPQVNFEASLPTLKITAVKVEPKSTLERNLKIRFCSADQEINKIRSVTWPRARLLGKLSAPRTNTWK